MVFVFERLIRLLLAEVKRRPWWWEESEEVAIREW